MCQKKHMSLISKSHPKTFRTILAVLALIHPSHWPFRQLTQTKKPQRRQEALSPPTAKWEVLDERNPKQPSEKKSGG